MINIPGLGEIHGGAPIVVLGPNGSGKTRLAQKIAKNNQVSAISAQRRTWVDDTVPVQNKAQLQSQVESQQNQWRDNSWRPTEEINFLLSTLIQDHTNHLTKRNEEAIEAGNSLAPVRDTNLIRLQELWKSIYPNRKLEVGGFFPTVKRLDAGPDEKSYPLREMSDGERTVLYMAARVLTAQHPVILVDEPELHMHSRLAVLFWNTAEKLRLDCSFIYVTHDLNFALSRRSAKVLIAQSSDKVETVAIDQIPSSVAAEVLGAATLPFFAKRIVFFEGKDGRGFASDFFSAWFDDEETFAIPAGNRDSVFAAVSGLKTVGIVAAEVMGLVDRDFYSDSILNAVTDGVSVLPLLEIESTLCDEKVVAAVAEHLGKDPAVTWKGFVDQVRKEFRGQTFNGVVARRVRSRVGDLLDGAFKGAQVVADLTQTGENHASTLSDLNLPSKVKDFFKEESKLVQEALDDGGTMMLAILPGKHLLSLLANQFGQKDASELTSLVLQSLDRNRLKENDPLVALGTKVEAALRAYLPPRIAQSYEAPPSCITNS